MTQPVILLFINSINALHGSSGCHDNAQFHIYFLSVHIYMKDSENGLLHQTKHLIKLKFMSRHLLGKNSYACSILPGNFTTCPGYCATFFKMLSQIESQTALTKQKCLAIFLFCEKFIEISKRKFLSRLRI